uniref:Uncharacterized protein n=1 Tax=Panagrolaimus sp. JU765 TaxID=591449 RepID=A0AC34QEM8_9BILA
MTFNTYIVSCVVGSRFSSLGIQLSTYATQTNTRAAAFTLYVVSNADPCSSGKAPGKRLWSAQNPPLTFRELIPKNYKSSRYVDDKDKENASGLTLSKSVPKKQPSTPAIPRRPLALKKF